MTAPSGLEQRLLAFRRAFDQSFAAAPGTTVEAFVDLLAIRVAGHPHALRAREIAGLVASRKIVPLPSRKLELLGLAGHRGRLVAVYSLAALLGYGVDGKTTSWLALVGAHEPVGLGFEAFDGFLRVRSGDIHAAHAVEGAGPQAGEVVVVGTQSRRIVDIPSTLGMLDVHTGAAGSLKES